MLQRMRRNQCCKKRGPSRRKQDITVGGSVEADNQSLHRKKPLPVSATPRNKCTNVILATKTRQATQTLHVKYKQIQDIPFPNKTTSPIQLVRIPSSFFLFFFARPRPPNGTPASMPAGYRRQPTSGERTHNRRQQKKIPGSNDA